MLVALNCSASAIAAFESGGQAEPGRLWRCRWARKPHVPAALQATHHACSQGFCQVARLSLSVCGAADRRQKKWPVATRSEPTNLASNAVHRGLPGGCGTPLLNVLPHRLHSARPCSLHALIAAAAPVHWPQSNDENAAVPACLQVTPWVGRLQCWRPLTWPLSSPGAQWRCTPLGRRGPATLLLQRSGACFGPGSCMPCLCTCLPWGHAMAWQAALAQVRHKLRPPGSCMHYFCTVCGLCMLCCFGDLHLPESS